MGPRFLSAGLTSTSSPVTAFTAAPLERCLSACKRDFFFLLLRRVDGDSDELNKPVYIDLTRRARITPWREEWGREFQEVTKRRGRGGTRIKSCAIKFSLYSFKRGWRRLKWSWWRTIKPPHRFANVTRWNVIRRYIFHSRGNTRRRRRYRKTF